MKIEKRVFCPECGTRNHPGNVYCRDEECKTLLKNLPEIECEIK